MFMASFTGFRCTARVLSPTTALALGLICATVQPGHSQAVSSGDLGKVQAIEVAESTRATSPEGREPILSGLKSPSIVVRIFSVRALGRLEDPTLASSAAALLADVDPSVRAEAANAVAQCYFNVTKLDLAESSKDALMAALAKEHVSATKAALLQSVARLPYSAATAASVADAITAYIAPPQKPDAVVRMGVAVAMENLFRLQKGNGSTPASIAALKSQFALGAAVAPRTRVLTLMALTAAGAADASLLKIAQKDPEQEVRRTAAVAAGSKDGLSRLLLTMVVDPIHSDERSSLIEAALADPAPMVRVEGLQAYTTYLQTTSCKPLLHATHDTSAHAPLLALDMLGKGCPAAEMPEVVARLKEIVATLSAHPEEGTGSHTWHLPAHAVVSLAMLDKEIGAQSLPSFVASPSWETRMYAAKAAAALGDVATLKTMAADPDPNVVATVLQGLSKVEGHAADAVYVAALTRLDDQVGVAAAKGLLDTKDSNTVAPMIAALGAYTALHKDNTRDPRIAILRALKSAGTAANAADLMPYVHDFDPAVATLAAANITLWTGKEVVAASQRPVTPPPVMADVLKLQSSVMKITMKNGGIIEIALYPEQAPATVDRMVTLTRAGYFNGLTLHRWAPNWVIQGGSPEANELVGASPFMNDEVGQLPHRRGAMGISNRAHDTGDAQLFVDLNENDRLSHGYSVWGQVVKGMPVVDTVMEADIMQKVEIVPATGHAK
jgi:cyclophilin family peptidyl-prolyl cis-trans isomerase/HEAT repeat protein